MITVEHLSKRYDATPVVRDVSFVCEPGTITGFLGPNGAGKSTTLRMLCGLSRPDRGRALIAGRPFTELPNPSRIVGILLDPTAMHPGRTGRATLRIAARMLGVPPDRADAVLHQVGLTGNAPDRRVGNYSLGMRQRLGIAQALLGEPEALVFDEPANGLDPEGIAWLRHLLRDFADRGGTVLLSSHLLSEVQATVDHLVVIADGAVAASGPMQELLATSGVIVRSPQPDALRRMLDTVGARYTSGPDGAFTVDGSVGAFDAERLGLLSFEQGVPLAELRAADSTGLESLFFSLTSTSHSEGAAA